MNLKEKKEAAVKLFENPGTMTEAQFMERYDVPRTTFHYWKSCFRKGKDIRIKKVRPSVSLKVTQSHKDFIRNHLNRHPYHTSSSICALIEAEPRIGNLSRRTVSSIIQTMTEVIERAKVAYHQYQEIRREIALTRFREVRREARERILAERELRRIRTTNVRDSRRIVGRVSEEEREGLEPRRIEVEDDISKTENEINRQLPLGITLTFEVSPFDPFRPESEPTFIQRAVAFGNQTRDNTVADGFSEFDPLENQPTEQDYSD